MYKLTSLRRLRMFNMCIVRTALLRTLSAEGDLILDNEEKPLLLQF